MPESKRLPKLVGCRKVFAELPDFQDLCTRRFNSPSIPDARRFNPAPQPWSVLAPMRCYFNLVNGTQEIVDDDGIEVSTIEQARAQALKAVAELRQEEDNVASEWKDWRIEVADEDGHVLFTISLAIDLH